SRRRGIQCAATCDCLSVHTAGTGSLSPAPSRHCSAKVGLLGAQDSPVKMSPALEKKSETVARLRGFSRSARYLDTIRTSLLERIIRITKSRKLTCGAMTRDHLTTIGIFSSIQRIYPTITRMKKCARAISRITGLSRFDITRIRLFRAQAAQSFSIFGAA